MKRKAKTVRRSPRNMHAMLMGTSHVGSDKNPSVLVLSFRCETNVPSYNTIGDGSGGWARIRGRNQDLDFHLELPMVASRENMARALEAFAQLLRDPRLGEP